MSKPLSLLLGGLIVALIASACGDGGDTSSTGKTPSGTAPNAVADVPDYSDFGPYQVGIISLVLPDDRPVDVWYPAADGATDGAIQLSVNLNDPWPESIRTQVPQVDDLSVDAYLDVAASDDGPFPVILESHGFGSYRRDGAVNHSHLASWGFIVIAPEHFERNRAFVIGQPVEFEELENSTVLSMALDLAIAEAETAGSPIEGAIDASRLAVDGISAGGRAALEFGADPRVAAVIARAPAGSEEIALQAPVLLFASDGDIAVELEDVQAIYEQLGPPRRLAVIFNGGHNTFTDSCSVIRAQGGLDIAALSEATGFSPELLELGNNGCTEAFVDPEVVRPLISHLRVAHIRAALSLHPDDSALTTDYIEERFPGLLVEYRSDP